MKNNSMLYLLGCFALLSFSSCLFQEENLFDESPAKRINTELQKDFDLLSAPSNGWIMDFFPTYEQEGYTFLMNFDKSGAVKIAAKNRWFNNQYADRTSLYEMIGDNGPVLSLNTYNPLFHFFANPEDLSETSDNESGRGLEGDYEFIIMQSSSDKFLLKGKKRGVLIDLRRLPDGQDWRAYFQQLDNLNTFLFDKNTYYKLYLQTGDSVYTLTNGISHIFTSVPLGGDEITDSEKIPFILTDYGICLSQPFNAARTFQLSEDKNSLICVDQDVNAKITPPYPVDLFSTLIDNRKNMTFTYSDAAMSASVKNVYAPVENGIIERGRRLDYIHLTYNRDWGFSMAIRTSRTGGTAIEGFLSFKMTPKSNTELDLTFNGFTGSFNSNGKTYYDTYAGVSDFVNMLQGSYRLAVQGNAWSSNTVRFTSVSDSGKWFDLVVK